MATTTVEMTRRVGGTKRKYSILVLGGKLEVGGDFKKRGVLFLEVNQSIWVVINLSLNIIEP